MSISLPKATEVDVMIFAEGTYPYVRGGVSSWIHQLIVHLDSIRFGICFIGSRPEDYGEVRYEFPDNLLHVETHYMFDSLDAEVEASSRFSGEQKRYDMIRYLHEEMKGKEGDLASIIADPSFFTETLSRSFFLHGKGSWRYLNEQYMAHCPDLPFIDYFWTIRNMHSPLWLLAEIAEKLPRCAVLHSPSTGYAGFVAALHSYFHDIPFYLTEHGIYTRERKIELLNAEWITYRTPLLMKSPEEFNYIKHLWIEFFTRLGLFSYRRAEKIFSLFPEAQKIQWSLGAAIDKTEVIPNGVDTERLARALEERPPKVPPVISLIGRVVPIKDIKTFIRAMRIVADRIPDVEGWIVGPTDEDEEYYDECVKMVESLDLQKSVRFLGFQNILDIFPKTGLMTLTSISEGMPLTILEGFAAGIPCVATDVGSCRDLIEGGLDERDREIGIAGAVTEIANPAQLAHEYLHFLENETVWRAAQKSALERVQRSYRQESFLRQYENYYRKAMKHGRHRV